jgi:hypothetical protein
MSEIIGKVVGFILIVLVIAIITALPIMWFWNDLMPDLFNLKTIGLWKAFEMGLLSSILFKSSSSSKN